MTLEQLLEISINLLCLRWGWVFLEGTRILSATHFIEIFVMETK